MHKVAHAVPCMRMIYSQQLVIYLISLSFRALLSLSQVVSRRPRLPRLPSTAAHLGPLHAVRLGVPALRRAAAPAVQPGRRPRPQAQCAAVTGCSDGGPGQVRQGGRGGRFLLISTWGIRPSPVGFGSALRPPCNFSACCRGLCLGGDAASTVLSQLLLPPLVWQAGKTSAAVRFSAITALATMLRRRLVPGPVLLELVVAGSLLPPINQSMDEVGWRDGSVKKHVSMSWLTSY